MPDVKWWVFRRAGSKRFTFSWAPDPANPKARKQKLLPQDLRTEGQATAYARVHLDELTDARAPTRKTIAGPTVAQLAEKCIEYWKADDRKAWSTITDRASHMKKWIVPMLGTEPVQSLNVPRLRQFVRDVRVQVAAYTCRNILSTLTIFLNDIVAEGWVAMDANPAEHQAVRKELPEQAPRAGRSQKLRTSLECVQALLDCEEIPRIRRVLYAVTATSGLRAGELFGLRLRRVHLDADPPRMGVEQAVQLKHREGHAREGKTKTAGSVRTLPLHPAAAAAIRGWLADGWENLVGRVPAPDDLVFPRDDGEPWRPKMATFFRADLKRIGASTHVDGRPLTFHGLRGLFAQTLRAEGVPYDDRAGLMGHTPKGVEQRHYSEGDLRVAAEQVSRIKLTWRCV